MRGAAGTLLALLLILLKMQLGRGLPRSIRIAGLFEHDFRGQEVVFKYATERINSRRDLLPFTQITYDIQDAPADDSFTAAKKVCRQVKSGVAAIFGPMSSLSASHVQSICDALEIPHVETRQDLQETPDIYSINLYPHYRTLGKAFADVVNLWQWASFTILYQRNEGLIRLQELLKLPNDVTRVTVRRLEPSDENDFRPILKEIKTRGDTRLVVDCDFDILYEVLKQAQTIDMITQYYHYHVTSLDLELVDLEDFKYAGTNITGFRLVDPYSPEVMHIMEEWQRMEERTGLSPLENVAGIREDSTIWKPYNPTTRKYIMTTETALMYDAVHMFAHALDQVSHAQDIETTPLSCSRAQGWNHGNSLLNYMKMIEFDGLTGKVKYDGEGLRSDFKLDLVELSLQGLKKVGVWDRANGINITQNYTKVVEQLADSLKNTTLRVTTIMESPYVMIKEGDHLTGNDRFEGYCVDLLGEIAAILQFNFSIHLVGDGQYGAPSGENGEWTGMVKELMDKKADLAVAPLTISYSRELVIDFTKPFMNLGISILFKRPEKQNPSLFSFLSPLSFDIWIYMMAAYLVVSFILFVLARFSPYEWYNPHPCNPESDVVENQFTLLNSLWFTIGSLMQQGSEVAPRAISTRIVSGIWWFFTLIIISSYTANLAAFLTVERMTSPIENADDLAKQTKIKYGSVQGGSTMTFFRESKIATYERMWNFMSNAKPSVFKNSTNEGIKQVKRGNYAFLLESTMNEYQVQRDCDLIRVGGLLDSKGYGIGTPRDSPYRDLISNAILKLQEDQILQMLYNQWWKQRGAKQCEADDGNKKDANALAIANVGGVFVVLIAGLLLSLIVSVLEFIWKSRKNADSDRWNRRRQPLCMEMLEELRFAARCFGSSKKTLKKKAAPPPPDYYIEGNGTTLLPLTGNVQSHRGYTLVGPKESRA